MLSRQVLRAARAAAPPQLAAVRPVVAVRTFAAAAASDNQSPISVFGIDGIYASALYTAASKTSSLESTARAMAALATLVQRDGKLPQVLATPTLTAQDKAAIVAELAKHAGSGSQATVKNFFDTLAENNRLALLPGVCDKFARLMAAARGEVQMTVISAQQLDSRSLSRLEAAVSKSSHVGPGKKLKVTNEVNPNIVGGLIVEVGDRTIDLSVSARIARMNKLLTESV